jgi:hypothetical protein
MKRRVKRAQITTQFMSLIFGAGLKSYEIIKDAVPEDAQVIGARLDPFIPEVLELLLQSKEFEEVEDGAKIPEVQPLISMKRLNWTPVKPTEPGWYWYRDREMFATRPTLLLIEIAGGPWIRRDVFTRALIAIDGKFNGLWAGPLTPPEGI